VEKNMRRRDFPIKKTLLISSLSVGLCVATLDYLKPVLVKLQPGQFAEYDLGDPFDKYCRETFLQFNEKRHDYIYCRYTNNSNLLLIGDSKAQHLYPGLAAFSKVTLVGMPGCPYFPNYYRALKNGDKRCQVFQKDMKHNLLKLKTDPIKHVLVSFYQSDHMRLTKGQNQNTEKNIKFWVKNYKDLEAELADVFGSDVKFVIIMDIPSISENHITCGSSIPGSGCLAKRDIIDVERKSLVELKRALSVALPNSIIIDPIEVICDQKACSTRDKSGRFLYRDRAHLTKLGSEIVGKFIVKNIEPRQ
jgi:hypothetical protein